MQKTLGCALLLTAVLVSIFANTAAQLLATPSRVGSLGQAAGNGVDGQNSEDPRQSGKASAYKALACEGGQLPLACPADTFINVTMAMYGREDNVTCPHASVVSTSCSSPKALPTLQALCNGRTYCDVDALSYYYGDPCNGTYKYLRLEYSCEACVNKHSDDAQCEMWALLGNCVTNKTWMEANCSKACFKCESVIDPVFTNVLDTASCAQKVAAGDCKKSPAMMGAYCKKACVECEEATTCENKVKDADCANWTNNSQCISNSGWMLPNCRKSCFGCTGTIKCENRNPLCDYWALVGECGVNPGFMMPYCTKSCLGCTSDPVCVDKSSGCDAWAKDNQCVVNPVWMHKNCWKSCMQCSAPAVCVNTLDDAMCEVLAARGDCSTNYDFMISNCRLACTRCKALPYGRPKCVNAVLNDTDCDARAKAGECTSNSVYMMASCYKACTGCYKPYRIGNSALPGPVLADNAAYSVVLPYAFTAKSVINQFIAFYASLNPVYLQVWRPNGTYTFNLVFNELVHPTAVNQAQTLVMKWCITVEAGDRIGFTSMNGPSSIAYRTASPPSYYPIAQRNAASTGEFFIINIPVEYSLSADFFYGSSCL